MKDKLNKVIGVIQNWYHYPNQITAAALGTFVVALILGRLDIAIFVAVSYFVASTVAIVYLRTAIQQHRRDINFDRGE